MDLVVEALTKAGRTDLIGFDKHCYGRTNAKDRYAVGDKNRRTAGGGNNRGRTNASEKKNTKKTIRNVHHKKAGAGKK